MKRPITPRPLKRKNPSGKTAWVARYPCKDGRYRSAGTCTRQVDAQRLIDAAMDREWSNTTDDTIAAYLPVWLRRHPRADRTNRTNEFRIRSQFDVEIEGVKIRDWRFADWRRRHTLELVNELLLSQGRASTGAVNILRSFSAMATNAVDDEVIETNPFLRVSVRANDSRIRKARAKIRVWSMEEMRAFARAAGDYEPLIRLVGDCFMRISECFALEQGDLDPASGLLRIERSMDDRGRLQRGTKTTHHLEDEEDLGRTVALPDGVAAMLWEMAWPASSRALFVTPTGLRWKSLSNFYRDVWFPAQYAWARPTLQERGADLTEADKGKNRRLRRAAQRALVVEHGFDIRPHELRHSMITHLAAAGVDIADLAEMSGHSIETLNGIYRHATNASYDKVKELIG